jgi:hypothetical protein
MPAAPQIAPRHVEPRSTVLLLAATVAIVLTASIVGLQFIGLSGGAMARAAWICATGAGALTALCAGLRTLRWARTSEPTTTVQVRSALALAALIATIQFALAHVLIVDRAMEHAAQRWAVDGTGGAFASIAQLASIGAAYAVVMLVAGAAASRALRRAHATRGKRVVLAVFATIPAALLVLGWALPLAQRAGMGPA